MGGENCWFMWWPCMLDTNRPVCNRLFKIIFSQKKVLAKKKCSNWPSSPKSARFFKKWSTDTLSTLFCTFGGSGCFCYLPQKPTIKPRNFPGKQQNTFPISPPRAFFVDFAAEVNSAFWKAQKLTPVGQMSYFSGNQPSLGANLLEKSNNKKQGPNWRNWLSIQNSNPMDLLRSHLGLSSWCGFNKR